MHTLTLIISTLNEGILRMENAVKIVHPQIKYLIIHQNNCKTELPSFLKREDIEVITTQTTGLSKSRNIGVRNCKTTYAIIGDDDVEYLEEGIAKVLEIIKAEVPDFAAFKIKTPDDEPEFKEYATEKHAFETHYPAVASIEILINIEKIKSEKIAFDERFGLGTRLRQGEEEIFIKDLIKNNLKGFYYPIFLVKHPFESTGTKPIKESLKYFLKGAFSKRTDKKIMMPDFDSPFRELKNKIFFYLGKVYILVTKRTYL